jgi:hypothetical protein
MALTTPAAMLRPFQAGNSLSSQSCSYAIPASVAGRTVNAAGRGLGGVSVSITDGVTTRFARTSSFGYFSFSEVPMNVQSTITAKAKLYTFTPQQVTPVANVSGLVFTGTQ